MSSSASPNPSVVASSPKSTTFIVESDSIFSGSETVKSNRISDIGAVWDPKVTSSPVCEPKDEAVSPVTASHVGHRVCIGGTKVGILRYFGEIELSKGTFCGVELDEPAGLNDGSVQGTRYFTCRPQHGIFAPVHIVRPLPGGSWNQQFRRKLSPDAYSRRRSATFSLDDSSGPYSLLDGITTPDDIDHMEKNGDLPESGQEAILSSLINRSRAQTSPGSTPTPSSTASITALWDCWGQQISCSAGSSESRKQSHPSQEPSKQSSLELDESLGILTPDQLSTSAFNLSSSSLPKHCQFYRPNSENSFDMDENFGVFTPDQVTDYTVCAESSSVSRTPPQNKLHQPQQISKQSSFELDESLGILTPDQMIDFTVCADSSSVGRTPSFEDMGVFLLGDYKGDRADDLLPDRMPSESDGPSSSNYPSSEFPQFHGDIADPQFQPPEEAMHMDDDNFLVSSKVEDVSMQELDLMSNDATTPDQQHCVSNQALDPTMCCTSEELSDNVCPAVTSKSSDGDFTPASIRIGQDISDRTLSPEDLPMDAPYQEVMSEILQKTELTSESGHETAGMSGATSAGPSSRSSAAPPPPSSFVTSVTSITSLDNGYQGDGEWSRPASRGADHSPTSHRVIKLKNSVAPPDPMTDSDFFTESDADMHDELASGSGRGDRRAQVIDGTLYGANLQAGGAVLLGQQHQRCPSFTASINEEMESSGVYSDLERRPEDAASDGKEFQGEERSPAEPADFSPDVSTKTVSSRSEQSQVKDSPPAFTTIIPQATTENINDMPVAMDTSESVDTNEMIAENNLKNQQQMIVVNQVSVNGDSVESCLDRTIQTTEVTSGTTGVVKSPSSTSNSVITSTNNKVSKEESHHQLKKYKMPKRNVVSKIKAMIESSSTSNGTRNGGSASTEDENQENRRPTRSPSKSTRKSGGRWDAVMNKIAQGQAEQKLKPRSLKEVKSKVFANITPAPAPQGEPRRSTDRTRKTSSSSMGPSSNSRALKENSPLKTKSRRTRTRASTSSLSQQQQQSTDNTNGPGRVSSPNSSPHSSISDVSVNQSHELGKTSSKSSSSLRSSKKRDVGRSTSPLSDGSTNSTTSHVLTRSSSNHINPLNHHARPPGHNSTARERVLRDNANRNTAANSQKQRQPRNPRSLLSNVTAKHLIGRKSSTNPDKEKNGVNVTAVVDMKTPPARKQASRRSAPSSGQKPTPLRDHNRQQQATGGGGVFKPGAEAPPSSKPGEVTVPPHRSPSVTTPQPTLAELLLPQLRHNSAGFEALSVLVQYLVYNLDAFSTPQLKKDLESMKTEWLKTKLELEEAQVSYRRIEDALSQEKTLHHQKVEELQTAQHHELTARDSKHSRELSELVARYEAQLNDFEKRLQEQLQEMKSCYEAEMSRTEQLNAEKLENVIKDGKSHLEKLQREHEVSVAHLKNESSERENQLRSRLSSLEEDYSGLKSQSRKLMDSMQQDKDTKLQATAGRCKELQDEVESLRTVLDLRHEELQELRKQNALLTREAEELPVALQRVAALEAKVEDLQVQLEMKTSLERQLSQDNRLLMESFHQESKQNKRLSLHNEELQWKLKQNIEVVNVLAALSGASMNSSMSSSMTGSLHNATTNGRSTHGSAQSLSDADNSGVSSQLFTNTRIPPRPLSAGRSHTTSGSDLSSSPATAGRSVLIDDLELSPPSSPKVKGVVEKSDSVSWVVEIDESPEALLSRLVRRAGSFRGTTPPPSSVSSPAHTRTLPPPKRQRCKASSLSLSSSATTIARPNVNSQLRNTPLTSSLRSRSRSVSTDSVEGVGLDYNSWAPTASSPIKGAVTNGSLKRQTSECSNDEDSPSKSPGSSGSSDGSVQKDREHSCRRNRKQISASLTDPSGASDSLDLGDTEVLPLPPLPGSTSGDLSLLAAQPLPPMPKESAGEAMISEETSEDENENEVEINSSSDERSCSEDEETSSSSGSSSDLGPVASRGLIVHEDGEVENTSGNNKQEEEEEIVRVTHKQEISSGQQNMTSSTGSLQQYHLLLMSDSGSYSATTTTMDLSWSEDMELMPSESEG